MNDKTRTTGHPAAGLPAAELEKQGQGHWRCWRVR
jgi:hypothetical protein